MTSQNRLVAHSQTAEDKSIDNSERSWTRAGDDEIQLTLVGGIGQIGMNMTVYGHNGRYIIVDAGAAFTGTDVAEKTGVTGRVVSFETLREIEGFIDGMIITHAHEDHIGGVKEILDHLDIPVFCTPLAAHIVSRKLDDANFRYEADIRTFAPGDVLDFGELKVETGAMSHSIPESCCLFISTTDENKVQKGFLHTGDYNMDPNPSVGAIDRNFLKRLGDEGRVGAVVGDSTNVEKDVAGSEALVAEGIRSVMASEKGGIFFVCFASNIGRIATIMEAAAKEGRQVAIAGRSMKNFVESGQALGYFDDLPALVQPSDLDKLPQRERVMIMTGTQGEPRSALARMLEGKSGKQDTRFPSISYGDAIVVSGRTIPHNVSQMEPILRSYGDMGIGIIRSGDQSNGYPIHTSGHATSEEILELYSLTKPDVVIPVHGENRHLVAHAMLAADNDMGFMIPTTGATISMKNDGLHHVNHIEVKLRDIMDPGFAMKKEKSALQPG